MQTEINNYISGGKGWSANPLVGAQVYASADEAASKVKFIRKNYPQYTVRSKKVGVKALGTYFVQYVVVVRSK